MTNRLSHLCGALSCVIASTITGLHGDDPTLARHVHVVCTSVRRHSASLPLPPEQPQILTAGATYWLLAVECGQGRGTGTTLCSTTPTWQAGARLYGVPSPDAPPGGSRSQERGFQRQMRATNGLS